MRPFIVAIDGPAGAGKSTTARGVAQRLGLLHVDSGAMYRAVAALAAREGVSLDDEPALVALLRRTKIDPAPSGMRVNGADVEYEIRTAEAGEAASRVALHPKVREVLVSLQRSFARRPGLVMEGRDIGTVVFPDADLKIFIVASPEARAERRLHEFLGRGESADLAAILESIRERDLRDSGRAVSPLKPAPDALELDTSDLTPEEQVNLAAHWAELARRGPGRMTPIYWFGKTLAQVFAKVFLDFHIEGLEHIPRKGPVLVACNHISFWDPPLVGSSIPRAVAFVAKAELFENRLVGALLRSYNAMPIQRGPKARAGLRGAEDVLSSGGLVLIFPEGTRNKSGVLLPPRGGVARLAAVTRTPVVPACITGSNQIRRSMLRQVPIRITFGPPMMPPRSANVEREEARRYAVHVMEAIADLLKGQRE